MKNITLIFDVMRSKGIDPDKAMLKFYKDNKKEIAENILSNNKLLNHLKDRD